MKYIAIVTTIGQRDEARRMAQELVARRLVACAQISEIESFYVWEGTLQHEPEFRLLLKTTADRYDEVERAIRELHGYELPAIHAIPLERIHAPYAAWIEGQCSGPEA